MSKMLQRYVFQICDRTGICNSFSNEAIIMISFDQFKIKIIAGVGKQNATVTVENVNTCRCCLISLLLFMFCWSSVALFIILFRHILVIYIYDVKVNNSHVIPFYQFRSNIRNDIQQSSEPTACYHPQLSHTPTAEKQFHLHFPLRLKSRQ